LNGLRVLRFVALIAIKFKGGSHLDFSVLNLVMAFETVDSMFGDMGAMNRIHIVGQLRTLFVAFVALIFWNIPITGRNRCMAGRALDAGVGISRMIERKSLMFNHPLWDAMANRARSKSSAFVGILKMTEVTRFGIDGEMLVRFSSCMTGRAT